MKFFLRSVCITNRKATFICISFCFMSFVLFCLRVFISGSFLSHSFMKCLWRANTRHSVRYVFNSRQDTAIQGGVAQYVKYVNRHYHKVLIITPPPLPPLSHFRGLKKQCVQVFSSALQHSWL